MGITTAHMNIVKKHRTFHQIWDYTETAKIISFRYEKTKWHHRCPVYLCTFPMVGRRRRRWSLVWASHRSCHSLGCSSCPDTAGHPTGTHPIGSLGLPARKRTPEKRPWTTSKKACHSLRLGYKTEMLAWLSTKQEWLGGGMKHKYMSVWVFGSIFIQPDIPDICFDLVWGVIDFWHDRHMSPVQKPLNVLSVDLPS